MTDIEHRFRNSYVLHKDTRRYYFDKGFVLGAGTGCLMTILIFFMVKAFFL